MEKGSIKCRLEHGEVTLGGWDVLNSAAASQVLAAAGYDWVAVDVEHGSSSIADFEEIAKAIRLGGSSPLARVFDKSMSSIRRVLDAGAEGIIVPMIRTVQDAKDAVAAAKYPPEGKRGAGIGAANLYGVQMNRYIAHANQEILVIVMVETKEAVENIDEILRVEGVDGIFLGPYDLSASYGITGQTQDPVIKNAIIKVCDACHRHKKAAGMHLLSRDEKQLQNALKQGFNFLALSYDADYLYSGSKQMVDAAHTMMKNNKQGEVS